MKTSARNTALLISEIKTHPNASSVTFQGPLTEDKATALAAALIATRTKKIIDLTACTLTDSALTAITDRLNPDSMAREAAGHQAPRGSTIWQLHHAQGTSSIALNRDFFTDERFEKQSSTLKATSARDEQSSFTGKLAAGRKQQEASGAQR